MRGGCLLSMGRRLLHSGSILILRVSASYWIMPFSNRNFENSMSLSVGILIWSAISFMLCHAPSLRIAKMSSMFNGFQCDIG